MQTFCLIRHTLLQFWLFAYLRTTKKTELNLPTWCWHFLPQTNRPSRKFSSHPSFFTVVVQLSSLICPILFHHSAYCMYMCIAYRKIKPSNFCLHSLSTAPMSTPHSPKSVTTSSVRTQVPAAVPAPELPAYYSSIYFHFHWWPWVPSSHQTNIRSYTSSAGVPEASICSSQNRNTLFLLVSIWLWCPQLSVLFSLHHRYVITRNSSEKHVIYPIL